MLKKIIGIVVVLFLLVAVGVTFFVVQRQQELRKKAAPATTLSFSPAQKTSKVDEVITLNVVMDTGGNQITSVQVKATYDPQYFEVLTMSNSAELPVILTAADLSTPGLATMHVGVPANIPFSGETIVATLRVKPLSPTTNPVNITLSGSYAQSPGEGSTNAIILTNPVVVTINNTLGDTTVTPTVIPDISVTTSPSPTNSQNLPSPTITSASPSPSLTAAAAGSFEIFTPTGNGSQSVNPPVFTGLAETNSSISIAISPGTISGAVIVASDGSWTFTPITTLDPGRYTATVVQTNQTTGVTKTKSIVFTIAAVGSSITPTPRIETSTVPVTGSVTQTVVMITFALILLGAGIIIPLAK